MDGRKLSAVDEVEHENKGKDIAHGEHLLSEKSSGYMKKELHRHHENADTALELFYGVLKKLSPLGLLYTCRVDIEREKMTVFDKVEFTFWRAETKEIWTEIGLYRGRRGDYNFIVLYSRFKLLRILNSSISPCKSLVRRFR